MLLHDEKTAALAEVLAASGEVIVWKGRTLYALVSDNPLSQDLELGGVDASRAERDSLPQAARRAAPEGAGDGDCAMKMLRSELGADRPKLSETLVFQGATCRITRVTDHPQFPMIVLVVEPED